VSEPKGKRRRLNSKRRFYILFVSRESDGTINKVPIPLHYATIFVAAAVIGMFTITGLAGSYSRMLVKTARFNQLRHDHQSLQNDYATLEKQAHQKDLQAASLGSLATEVSALYGLTANKIGTRFGNLRAGGIHAAHAQAKDSSVVAAAATAPLKDSETATAALNTDTYYRSIDAFYALRSAAMNGDSARILTASPELGRMENPLMPGHDLAGLGASPRLGAGSNVDFAANETPTLWPVSGPITSSFGERENPFGGDEGEFHPGIDISGPLGTPIHATADGVVTAAQVVNGYGREVTIDHGHGVETLYGHMSGFAVTVGQAITRGQIVGYIGHSGRTTGNHVHYEVRIHNTPVNPHKYLRTTLADFSSPSADGPGL
jgi:murein DD-endopeptidase MepM/ murein hydrolase activator NlpD